MVIDTSAIVAILLREPEADRLVAAIDKADTRHISAATVVETSLVMMGRLGEPAEAYLGQFLRAIAALVVPVDEEQVALARDGGSRFGRGRHPAGLNYGDCFSYALAIARREPLLFVGSDFSQTDVDRAEW